MKFHLEETISFKTEKEINRLSTYWQKVGDLWKFFTSVDKEVMKQEIRKLTRIEGLTAIRVSGGIWENWDADVEKDGPVIEIVYLDRQGNIITSDSTEIVPISADVKIFTTDTSDFPHKKGRLVYSSHYSKDKIILGWIYPKIRIPKEEINVNPMIDYQYGYILVTIHTPEQGSFSDGLDWIVLYEK